MSRYSWPNHWDGRMILWVELISYSVECGPSSEDLNSSSAGLRPVVHFSLDFSRGFSRCFFCTSHSTPPEHSNGRGYTPIVDRFYVVPGHEVMPKNQTLPWRIGLLGVSFLTRSVNFYRLIPLSHDIPCFTTYICFVQSINIFPIFPIVFPCFPSISHSFLRTRPLFGPSTGRLATWPRFFRDSHLRRRKVGGGVFCGGATGVFGVPPKFNTLW